MPSRKSYSCGGVIIGRPSDGRRKPREQEREREGEKGEKTGEKGEGEMNLLGGLGGDRSEKKHGNVCATEVVFVGATKTGLIFLLFSLCCNLVVRRNGCSSSSSSSSYLRCRVFHLKPRSVCFSVCVCVRSSVRAEALGGTSHMSRVILTSEQSSAKIEGFVAGSESRNLWSRF